MKRDLFQTAVTRIFVARSGDDHADAAFLSQVYPGIQGAFKTSRLRGPHVAR